MAGRVMLSAVVVGVLGAVGGATECAGTRDAFFLEARLLPGPHATVSASDLNRGDEGMEHIDFQAPNDANEHVDFAVVFNPDGTVGVNGDCGPAYDPEAVHTVRVEFVLEKGVWYATTTVVGPGVSYSHDCRLGEHLPSRVWVSAARIVSVEVR